MRIVPPSRARTSAARAALLAALYLSCSGHIGHCTHEDEALALPPPHARARVLEGPDGRVEVSLRVFSTATEPVAPVQPTTALFAAEPEAAFLEPTTTGELVGTADAFSTSAYTVYFTLAPTDLAAGGDYQLTMHGPATRPRAWWNDDRTVGWEPSSQDVYLEVRDAEGHRRWSNLDGLAFGGEATLPAAALDEGSALWVCGAEVAHQAGPSATAQHLDGAALSGRLGSKSAMVVGRCTALEL